MKKIKLLIALFFIGIFVTVAQQKKFITYKVQKGETVQSISKKIAITPYDLLKLNPDIKDNISANDIIIIPNKDYEAHTDVENSDLSIIGEKDIIVDNFIYHEVLKKETLYSLLKKFQTSIDQLNNLNPYLINNGLKQGQILKIPIVITDLQISEKNNLTKPYLVKPKETKYSISKFYGISISYLEELNPKIREKGLQIDDVILVPSEVVKSSELHTYKIKKQETLYSLSHKFGVSQEELIEENPQLKENVIAGMLIKIPKNSILENRYFSENNVGGIKLDIALMLPFKSNKDSLDFEHDKLLKISSDFYFGALIALDSLKKKGLSMNVNVFDTENSEAVTKKISSNNNFEHYNAIIGPMFLKNVKAVSNSFPLNNTLIISPISSKDHSKISNKNLVQDVAPKENLALEMLEFIKKNYSNQKMIIITDDKQESSNTFHLVERELRAIDSLKQIVVLKPKKGYIKPEIFRENIDEKSENWIFMIGDDETFVRDVFNNLGVLPIEDNLTLFSFDKGKIYDNIDNNYFSRVNFHYPTTFCFQNNLVAYQNFEKKFIKKYHAYPSKYAVQGFDITYDILLRLTKNELLIEQGESKRIASKFNYIENTSGSVVNNGVFIVKYDGLELKIVN